MGEGSELEAKPQNMLSSNCYQPYSRKTEIILRLSSLFPLEQALRIKYWLLWGLIYFFSILGNAYDLSLIDAKPAPWNGFFLSGFHSQTFTYNYFIGNKLIKLMKLLWRL